MRPMALLLAALSVSLGVACGQPSVSAESSASRALTYVAIGASDSVGVGANVPETEGWVPVLHSRLPEGSRLVNVGVSGSLLQQALDQQLPVALDSDPDLVTVWLAVNDANARVPLDRYSGELDTLLRSLRGQTRAVVLVGNVPDVSSLPAYRQVERDDIARQVEGWNATIAEVVARHGAQLVDLQRDRYELGQHPEYVSRDGFHPSAEGYRRLAELFYETLVHQTDLL